MATITVKDLVFQVEIVRLAQNQYFNSRSRGALIASKEEERKLDKMLAQLKACPVYNGGAKDMTISQ